MKHKDLIDRGPQREAEKNGRKTRIGDPEIGAPPVIVSEFRACPSNAFLCTSNFSFDPVNPFFQLTSLLVIGHRVISLAGAGKIVSFRIRHTDDDCRYLFRHPPTGRNHIVLVAIFA